MARVTERRGAKRVVFAAVLLLWYGAGDGGGVEVPSLASPLVIIPNTKEVRIAGIIYPRRFNAATGEEARYHLLVWKGGTSPHALIETPVDDLDFYEALIKLGGKPGDNLSMAAWTERQNLQSTAPQAKVTGSALEVQIFWQGNPGGVPIDQAFRQPPTPNPQHPIIWRFGGNRDRWFNRVPLAPRPGCMVCLYSCPSGKVSNGALSIRDYVYSPARFYTNTDVLPPDGTPVVVTFRLLP